MVVVGVVHRLILISLVACNFSVMLLSIYDRGWASDSDTGVNNTYYLYSGKWSFMFSPSRYLGYHTEMFNLTIGAMLDNCWSDYTEGGVQF